MSVCLIVGTDKGGMLLRSDEAREQWPLGEMAFRGWRVTAAARDDSGRFYLAVATEGFGNGIMVSHDFEHWEHLPGAPRYEPDKPGNPEHNRGINFDNAAIDESITPANPLGLYARRHVDQIWKLHCAGDSVYAGVSEAGLFVSTDQGRSWQPVEGLNDHPSQPSWSPGFGGLALHSILSDAGNPDRMWVGISSSGVFRTDDGGRTWTEKNHGVPVHEGGDICVHGMAHDPQEPDRIFRQNHDGMFLSEDAGDSWRRIENGLPRGVLTFAKEPGVFGFPVEVDPATGYAYAFPLAGDDFRYPPEGKLRVYRTTDRGNSWEPLAEGMPNDPSYTSVLRGAMSVDRLDPCGVYIGTTSGHVFASNDRGDHWQGLPCTLPKILCVEAFPV
jgi:hypothetical protein